MRAWHAASRSGLGEDFLADVERVLEVIKQHPEACPVVHRTLRRGLLHQFPYSVYYRLLPAKGRPLRCARACINASTRAHGVGAPEQSGTSVTLWSSNMGSTLAIP